MVNAEPLRIGFFGTPAFALATLDALLASPHPVICVVTQPDRPRGRGQKTTDAPVKSRAVERGLPILQPTRLKDAAFIDALRAFQLDLGVVAAYGRILPESVLQVPRLGMVNVHASLLPKYRGAAPVHRAVIDGETETGVTIMRVVKALDAGPMISSEARQISTTDTSQDVERDLAAAGAALLVRTLGPLAAGTAVEIPQNDAQATYAPPIRKEEGLVDWQRPATAIHDLIRGLYPWPHAYTFRHGRRVVLLRSAVTEPHPGNRPGTVVAAKRGELRIATGQGCLDLLTVQVEGRRPMTARDFLAGHPVALGEPFSDE